MTLNVLSLLGLAGVLSAQTFPPEFKTDGNQAASRIERFLSEMAENPNGFPQAVNALLAVPARRIYLGLSPQARTAALQQTMPLVKQLAMSEAITRKWDEQIARQYGAVNHGLKLPPRGPDPNKRMEEMGQQIRKNPAVMQNPKFVKEFTDLQTRLVTASQEGLLNNELTRFTMPLADLKQKSAREREDARQSKSTANVAACYDQAIPLADTNADRFRLMSFRCVMMMYEQNKTEAEWDKMRKQAAQRLYDDKSARSVIRTALRSLLDAAAGVDFTAVTAPRGGYQVFTNPAYEKKCELWKMLYRNGKEPTAAVVQFAQQWLKEL